MAKNGVNPQISGVFWGQSQIKVDSNPELHESSLKTKELIWNHQVFNSRKWQNNDFMRNIKIPNFYGCW